jgi:hypothetical protein
MICGGNEGQMVDTGVDIPGDGRMYLCVRYCAPHIADLLQQREPEQRCAAMKANGQPCTAKALSGHEVCVAHLKVQREREEQHELVTSAREA